MPVALKTLYSFDTVYSADSVEWCPYPPWKNVLATGTYQVNKVHGDVDNIDCPEGDAESPAMERLGRIYLHQVHFEEGEVRVEEVQKLEVAAVLDMKAGI